MKIVSFAGLPFHRWCLEDLVSEARSKGHDVVEIEHRPQHAHHWWTGSAETLSALADASADADYIVVADYPYSELRRGLLRIGAKIVSVRHSLASRGNTYEKEQVEADILPMFSGIDRDLLGQRRLLQREGESRRVISSGCPWAARMCGTRPPNARAELLGRLGIDPADRRPIVAVATTWNEWTSLDVVRALAADGSRIVVWRPHWAASWRRPGEADRVRSFGAYIDDPLAHPAGLLMGADALVGDVSGIVLLATFVRTDVGTIGPGISVAGGLPIVQIDPTMSALSASGQFDMGGPEWSLRDQIGPRIPEAEASSRIVAEVDAILSADPWRPARALAAAQLRDPWTTPSSASDLIDYLENG